jgi:hypothetical protein
MIQINENPDETDIIGISIKTIAYIMVKITIYSS